MKKLIAFTAIAIGLSSPVKAQFAPFPGYVSANVGASSTPVTLPLGSIINVYNTGAGAISVTLGNASIVATANMDIVQPGSCISYVKNHNTTLAAIEQTATASSVTLSGGYGSTGGTCPAGGGGGSGGSFSGNITQWNSVGLGSPTAYGTAPSGNVIGANVDVTNANANGRNSSANSSPVVNSLLSHTVSTALETGHVIKASAGNLIAFNCSAIAGAAVGNCIALNATTVPATGTISGVISSCSFDTSARGCSISIAPNAIAAGTGIVVLISSAASPFTYTTGVLTGFIEGYYE